MLLPFKRFLILVAVPDTAKANRAGQCLMHLLGA
jgi:hypothetical protein